jgi:hypothetical protein
MAPPNHISRLPALFLATDSITSDLLGSRSVPVQSQLAIALGFEVYDLSGRGGAEFAPLGEDFEILLPRQPRLGDIQIALFVEQVLLFRL